ncbi:hypothetical protein BGZ65_001109, partial [Modicella reniformis]
MTKATITPDHINLLDTNHLQSTVQITLQNTGNTSESYTFSHVPADALNSYPSKNVTFPLPDPIIETDYAEVVFSQSKVDLPAGQSAVVTLRFQEPKNGSAEQFPIYSGYIVATPDSQGGVAVHVPYTGLKGDISKVPIMDTSLEFPAVRRFD